MNVLLISGYGGAPVQRGGMSFITEKHIPDIKPFSHLWRNHLNTINNSAEPSAVPPTLFQHLNIGTLVSGVEPDVQEWQPLTWFRSGQNVLLPTDLDDLIGEIAMWYPGNWRLERIKVDKLPNDAITKPFNPIFPIKGKGKMYSAKLFNAEWELELQAVFAGLLKWLRISAPQSIGAMNAISLLYSPYTITILPSGFSFERRNLTAGSLDDVELIQTQAALPLKEFSSIFSPRPNVPSEAVPAPWIATLHWNWLTAEMQCNYTGYPLLSAGQMDGIISSQFESPVIADGFKPYNTTLHIGCRTGAGLSRQFPANSRISVVENVCLPGTIKMHLLCDSNDVNHNVCPTIIPSNYYDYALRQNSEAALVDADSSSFSNFLGELYQAPVPMQSFWSYYRPMSQADRITVQNNAMGKHYFNQFPANEPNFGFCPVADGCNVLETNSEFQVFGSFCFGDIYSIAHGWPNAPYADALINTIADYTRIHLLPEALHLAVNKGVDSHVQVVPIRHPFTIINKTTPSTNALAHHLTALGHTLQTIFVALQVLDDKHGLGSHPANLELVLEATSSGQYIPRLTPDNGVDLGYVDSTLFDTADYDSYTESSSCNVTNVGTFKMSKFGLTVTLLDSGVHVNWGPLTIPRWSGNFLSHVPLTSGTLMWDEGDGLFRGYNKFLRPKKNHLSSQTVGNLFNKGLPFEI